MAANEIEPSEAVELFIANKKADDAAARTIQSSTHQLHRFVQWLGDGATRDNQTISERRQVDPQERAAAMRFGLNESNRGFRKGLMTTSRQFMPVTPPGPRITDLSTITPEMIKDQNTEFWLKGSEYETVVADHHTRRRIWNTRNGDLRRLLREFPRDAPLLVQCAGWVHAVAGREFFQDANHRTAIVLLRKLLRDNGIEPGKWPPEITRAASIRSHEVRFEMPNIRLDTLYEKDRLFLVWLLYFKTVMRVTGSR